MFLPVKMGELWPSCAEYRASCAEYRASCGRVVRVLGELLGEIVKFRQLAQKRLGGHLCLGGPTPNRLVYKISYKKLIIKLLVISKATAGEKHPQSGSQGACGPKIDPEATPEYKKNGKK